MAKKKINPDENEKPRVHKELEGFDIQINSFGEITTSFDIDKINQFLNKTVDDKKLRHRTDLNLKGDSTAPAGTPERDRPGDSTAPADRPGDSAEPDGTDTKADEDDELTLDDDIDLDEKQKR